MEVKKIKRGRYGGGTGEIRRRNLWRRYEGKWGRYGEAWERWGRYREDGEGMEGAGGMWWEDVKWWMERIVKLSIFLFFFD